MIEEEDFVAKKRFEFFELIRKSPQFPLLLDFITCKPNTSLEPLCVLEDTRLY